MRQAKVLIISRGTVFNICAPALPL